MAKDTWAIIGTLVLLVGASTGWVLRDLDEISGKVDRLSGAVGNLQQRVTLLDGRIANDAVLASHQKAPDVEAIRMLIDQMLAKGTLTVANANSIRESLESAQ